MPEARTVAQQCCFARTTAVVISRLPCLRRAELSEAVRCSSRRSSLSRRRAASSAAAVVSVCGSLREVRERRRAVSPVSRAALRTLISAWSSDGA